MVNRLSVDITKYWGFNRIVGEWDYLVTVEAPISVEEIQLHYFEWLSTVLDKLDSLHSVVSLEYSLVKMDKHGVEIDIVEGIRFKMEGEFNLSEFLSDLNATYNNYYLTNLNFELSTKVVMAENNLVIDNSAELMISFDEDISYFFNSPEFTFAYTTYIDVWFEETRNSQGQSRKNELYQKENAESLIQLLKNFSEMNNAHCYSYSSDNYYSSIDKNGIIKGKTNDSPQIDR